MHTRIHALTELSQRPALPLSAGVETKGEAKSRKGKVTDILIVGGTFQGGSKL